MNFRTIDWKNGKIRIIDQSRLPLSLRYIDIDNAKALWHAIRELKVRGAPALGAAAGLGVYLGIKNSKAKTFLAFSKELDKVVSHLAGSRPTARNLFWGIERACSIAVRNKDKSVPEIKKLIFREAIKIIEEDRIACRKIGMYGAKLFKNNDTVLTVCNAGILATIDYGTALGVIYRSKQDKKNLKVFACETRPLLQGARLTAWELKRQGIQVTLICDNMAATLMQQGKIDKVIVGADRIAANGDTANKIGTYGLAVLAKYHGIPFYVAAPVSTFDLNIHNGRGIKIEERPASEVTDLFFKRSLHIKGVKVYNPAFDVTPNNLITAIITDKDLIRAPYRNNIKKIIGVGREV